MGGPFSDCELSANLVEAPLADAIARAGFDIHRRPKVDHVQWRTITFDSERVELGVLDGVVGSGDRSIMWMPDPKRRRLERSLERILFASGAHAISLPPPFRRVRRCPLTFCRAWPHALPPGTRFITSPSFGSSLDGYIDGTIRLRPGTIKVFTGPAVEPATGEPSHYIALDYCRVSARPFLLGQTVAQLLSASEVWE
jgi:hypothetical protein